jgi:hypothetical protein
MTWAGVFFLIIVLSWLTYIVVMYYVLDLQTHAEVANSFFGYFFAKHFQVFHIQRIEFPSWWSVELNGAKIVIRATKKQPELSVSWQGFRFFIDRSRLLEPFISIWKSLFQPLELYQYSPAIIIEIEQFIASSPNAEFKHFLEGSTQKQPPKAETESSKLQQSFLMHYIMAIVLHFVGLFEIRFLSMSFEMNLPVNGCSVQGSADKLEMRCRRSQNLDTEGFTGICVIRGSALEIIDQDKRALFYSGHGARFAVDFVTANGHMDLMARIYGRQDDMEVHIRPFLSFYDKYQRAEDNALELKLARGFPIVSKMSMGMECEFMKVGIYDERMPGPPMIVQMEQISGSLASFRLTTDRRRTHKNKLCREEISNSNSKVDGIHKDGGNGKDDISPSMQFKNLVDDPGHSTPNKSSTPTIESVSFSSTKSLPFSIPLKQAIEFPYLPQLHRDTYSSSPTFTLSPHTEKVMIGSVAKVNLCLPIYINSETTISSTTGRRTFTDCTMQKVLKVNNLNPFVDDDELIGSVRSVLLENIDTLFLDWLCALQDVSNRLPSSRFSHQKNSFLKGNVASVYFSTNPISYRALESDIRDILRLVRCENDLPLPSITVDEERQVIFSITSMSMMKSFQCLTDTSSRYSVDMMLLEIITEMPMTEIEKQFDVCSLSESVRRSTLAPTISKKSTSSLSTHARKSIVFERLLADQQQQQQQNMESLAPSTSIQTQLTSKDYCAKYRSEWRFEQFSVAFWMGDNKMQFELLRIRAFILDFVHIPSSRELEIEQKRLEHAKLSYRSGNSRRERSVSSSSNLRPRARTRSENSWDSIVSRQGSNKWISGTPMSAGRSSSTSPFVAISTFNDSSGVTSVSPMVVLLPSLSRHLFMSCTNIRATWIGQAMSCTVATMHANVSIASILKFQSAYETIKRTSDRISLRMDLLKLAGSPKVIPFVERVRDGDISTSAIVADCSVTFSLSTSTPSEFMILEPNDKFDKIDDVEHPFAVMKFRKLLYFTSENKQSYGMEEMEMGLSSCSHTSMLTVRNGKLEKVKEPVTTFNDSTDTTSSVRNIYTDSSSGRKQQPRATVIIKQKTTADSVSIQFLSIMQAGNALETLLAQQNALMVALNRPKEREQNRLKQREIDAMVAMNTNFNLDVIDGTQNEVYCSRNDDEQLDFDYFALYHHDEFEDEEKSTKLSSAVSTEGLLPPSQSNTERERIETAYNISNFSLALLDDNDDSRRLSQRLSPSEDDVRLQPNSPPLVHLEVTGLSYFQHNNNLTQDELQEEVTLLDIGIEKLRETERDAQAALEDFLVYSSISGGPVSMGIQSVRVVVGGQISDPVVQIFGISLSGPMYQAMVKDNRIGREDRLLSLSDTVLLDVVRGQVDETIELAEFDGNNEMDPGYAQDESPQVEDESLFVRLRGVRVLGDSLYMLQPRSLAPNKTYCDLCLSAEHAIVSLGNDMSDALSQAGQVWACSLPPNRETSPPLTAVDSLRFLVHGTMSMTFQRLSIKQSAPGVLERVTVSVEIQAPELHIDHDSVQYTSDLCEIGVEIESHVLTGRARSHVKRKISCQRSTLCTIPCMVLALRHHFSNDWEIERLQQQRKRQKGEQEQILKNMEKSSQKRHQASNSAIKSLNNDDVHIYSHHDVYLRPALDPVSVSLFPAIEAEFPVHAMAPDELFTRFYLEDTAVFGIEFLDKDKFFFFRSRPQSIKWDLEMRFADDREKSISLCLSLDIVLRMLTAMTGDSQKSLKPKENQPPTAYPSSNPTNDQKYEADQTEIAAESSPSILSLVSQIDLQCVVNKIVFCSWLSSKDKKGIVVVQQLTDIQVRLCREKTASNMNDNQSMSSIPSQSTEMNSLTIPLSSTDAQMMRQWSPQLTNSLSQPYFIAPTLSATEKESSLVREKRREFRRLFSKSLQRNVRSLPCRVHLTNGLNGTVTQNEINIPPLEVQHLFVDMYFIDLFVRDWSVPVSARSSDMGVSGETPSNKSSKRRSNISTTLSEDAPPDHFLSNISPKILRSRSSKALMGDTKASSEVWSGDNVLEYVEPKMRAICKMAHASRVIMSLTRNGSVPNRATNFKSSGVLDRRDERLVRKDKPDDVAKQKLDRSQLGKDNLRKSSFAIGRELREFLSGECIETAARETFSSLRRSQLLQKSQSLTHSRPRVSFAPALSSTSISPLNTTKRSASASVIRLTNNISFDVNTSAKRAGRRQETESGIENLNNKWDPARDGFRASLFRFRTNHALFAPPSLQTTSNSTPTTANSERQRDRDSAKSVWGLRVVDVRILFSIPIRDCLFFYVSRCIDLFSSEDDQDTVNGTKEKGKSGPNDAVGSKKASSEKNSKKASKRGSVVDLLSNKDSDKVARLEDFLSVGPELSEPSPSQKVRKSLRNRSSSVPTQRQVIDSNVISPVEESPGSTEGTPMTALSLPIPESLVSRHLGITLSPQNSVAFLNDNYATPSTPITPLMETQQTLLETTDFTPVVERARANSADRNGVSRIGARRSALTSPPLLSTPKTQMSPLIPVVLPALSPSKALASNVQLRGPMRRGSLYNRSIELSNDVVLVTDQTALSSQTKAPLTTLLEEEEVVELKVDANDDQIEKTSRKSKSRGKEKQTENKKDSSVKSTVTHKSTKKVRAAMQRLFEVEIEDPQINFLDEQTHSSLIIIAGNARLTGQRSSVAILAHKHGSGESVYLYLFHLPLLYFGCSSCAECKRKREIKLQMDGVSAFTVPTLSSTLSTEDVKEGLEEEDDVHWKHMKSTSDAMFFHRDKDASSVDDRRGPDSNATNSDSGANSMSANQPSSRVERLIGDYGKVILSRVGEFSQSPLLTEAIRDFSIRALYIFFTDVSAIEARDMHIQQRKNDEDVIGTFRLELPDLLVDIYSWQFYAILNVIRNVLLLPPPMLDSARQRAREREGESELENSKVLELKRDADLMASHRLPVNLSQALDISRQTTKDELKVLVENSLDTALQVDIASQTTARFVEVFIGRMTWRLRNTVTTATAGLGPTVSAKDMPRVSVSVKVEQELVETALFGMYAQLNFSENR